MFEVGAPKAGDSPAEDWQAGYPLNTIVMDRLIAHPKALIVLFISETPLMRSPRPTDAHKLCYWFGNASTDGLTIITQYPDLYTETYDGLLAELFAEGGSNLREAQNFGNHLLHKVKAGKHDSCAVWACTDNSVWSAVWNKGMSTMKHLFNIALNLKVECQKHEVLLNTCYISGREGDSYCH